MGSKIECCEKCNGSGFVADNEKQTPWDEVKKLVAETTVGLLLILHPVPCPGCAPKSEMPGK